MNRVINILLVEDDVLDQKQVERAFDKKGILHKLKITRNGEEAMNYLKDDGQLDADGVPDIILLDISMPKMNGLEFLAELRRNDKLSNIKVFVLTNSDRERMKAEELGISGYILKPLKLNSPSMDSIPLMIDIINLQTTTG